MYKLNKEELEDIYWIFGEETGNEVALFVQEDLEATPNPTDFYEVLSLEMTGGVYVINRNQINESLITVEGLDNADLPPEFVPSNGSWSEFELDDPEYNFIYWLPRGFKKHPKDA